MTAPSLTQLNEDRKKGLRPGIILAILNEGRILLLFKRDHNLWELPQGGIENEEDCQFAIVNELQEELGSDFASLITGEPLFFGEDILETSRVTKELKTDEGEAVVTVGKKYYFFALNASSQTIDISKTIFDDYIWLDYKGAMFLTERMYQKKKALIVTNILNHLKELKLLI